MPTVFDGYVRVSRVGGREGDSFQSPEQQRAAITSWAASRGVEIAAWHTDLDVSGGVLTRPGLDALLARIRSGEAGGIAVARLDRLSRAGVGEALHLVEEITECGGQVAAVDLGLDPTTPFGEFGMTIMLALARMERRRIADSWVTSQSDAIRRGVHIGPTPLGYTRTESGTLAVDPETAPIVIRAYELAASSGLPAALAFLREQTPGRNWSNIGIVRRFLARRAVLGEVRSGDYVAQGTQPAIVSVSLWTAAQVGITARHRAPGTYPLSGFAVCGTCGEAMVGGRSGYILDGERRRTYRCRAGLAKHRAKVKPVECQRPASINADALEALVREQLAHVLDGLTVTVGTPSADLEDAEHALEDAEHELSAFAGDLELRRALGAGYAAARDARIAAVDAARAVYADAAKSSATSTIDAANLDAAGDLAGLARAVLSHITVRPGRGNVAERVTLHVIGE
jgi:DNA invertase Pin-like site-specific DNA recombinase